MKALLFDLLVVAALASRWLCVAGFVLAVLRLLDLVPVPWPVSLSLLFSPVLIVAFYAAIGVREARRHEPNAGGE